MKSPINIIYVTIDKRFDDEYRLDGVTLWKDTTFDVEWKVTCHGIVHSVPNRVETQFAEPDFQCNVLPGDKIYFNYQTLLDETNCVINDGIEYWRVDYFSAIAIVRDGKVIPVGSHILIEPQVEELTHSTLIIPELAAKQETNKGIVYSSNMSEIPPGSLVEFDPIGKFENEIEGKKLYCMYNSNIYLKYN